MISSSTYYIDKFNPAIYDHEYFYIDGISGDIYPWSDNWEFSLQFYIVNNFSLPPNCITCDMYFPTALVTDIPVVYSVNQATHNDYEKHYGSCYRFDAHFFVDMSQSDLTTTPLENYRANVSFAFKADLSFLSSVPTDISQEAADQFIDEVSTSLCSFDFEYSNYSTIDDSTTSFSIYNHYMISNECKAIYSEENTVKYTLLSEINPIKNLFDVEIADEKQALFTKAVYNFYYFVDGTQKTLSYEELLNEVCSYKQISFKQHTIWDEATNQLIVSSFGNDGFFSGYNTSGYIVVELYLNIENINYRLDVKIPFRFVNGDVLDEMIIMPTVLDSLADFKEITNEI